MRELDLFLSRLAAYAVSGMAGLLLVLVVAVLVRRAVGG